MEKPKRFTLHLDKVLQAYINDWETSDVSLIDVTIFIESSLLHAYYFLKGDWSKLPSIVETYESILKFSLAEQKRVRFITRCYNKTYVFAKCLNDRLDFTFLKALKEEEMKTLSVVVYDRQTGLLIMEYP